MKENKGKIGKARKEDEMNEGCMMVVVVVVVRDVMGVVVVVVEGCIRSMTPGQPS